MTGFRWLASVAVGLICVGAPSVAAAFDAQAARKICLERYNIEKDSGTIPAGMPKSKYVNQCTSSMRREAELEKNLAQQQTAQAAGSNEITATATQSKPSGAQPRTSKPTTVGTPSFAPPKGY